MSTAGGTVEFLAVKGLREGEFVVSPSARPEGKALPRGVSNASYHNITMYRIHEQLLAAGFPLHVAVEWMNEDTPVMLELASQAEKSVYLRATLGHIIEFYEDWDRIASGTGKAEKAAEWRLNLEKWQATTRPATTQPAETQP